MAYEGEQLLECPAGLSFENTWAVVVSGASWNPCGHMILCCGTDSNNSWYCHVAGAGAREVWGVWGYPKFMREEGYFRYLSDNGKKEIRRLDCKIKKADASYQKMTDLMQDKWFWGVLINNCATFVKEIINAGGGDLSVMLNCPDQEVVKKIGKVLEDAGKRMGEAGDRGPKW